MTEYAVGDELHERNLQWYRDGGRLDTHARSREIISAVIERLAAANEVIGGLKTEADQAFISGVCAGLPRTGTLIAAKFLKSKLEAWKLGRKQYAARCEAAKPAQEPTDAR